MTELFRLPAFCSLPSKKRAAYSKYVSTFDAGNGQKAGELNSYALDSMHIVNGGDPFPPIVHHDKLVLSHPK